MNEQLTASKLWKRMTLDQRTQAARAFWGDEEAAGDHVQAAIYIAQQKKFRPKTVALLDIDRKARHLGSLKLLPDFLAARALIVYHLAEQRPMMSAFLDALGIAHEDGLIKDDNVAPEKEKLAVATAAIAGQFSREDVSLYLNTLLCQDPDTWGALSELPQLAAEE
jgi:hypothetical protein